MCVYVINGLYSLHPSIGDHLPFRLIFKVYFVIFYFEMVLSFFFSFSHFVSLYRFIFFFKVYIDNNMIHTYLI